MTSCSLIIKYRIREVTSQKTAISLATAVGTGESVVVYSVGLNSLWKKPWSVHTYTARVQSRIEQLQSRRSFSAQCQFFSTSSLQARLSVYITLARTELSDFQRTDLNPILGIKHYELCYVEMNRGQL